MTFERTRQRSEKGTPHLLQVLSVSMNCCPMHIMERWILNQCYFTFYCYSLICCCCFSLNVIGCCFMENLCFNPSCNFHAQDASNQITT